MDKNKTITIEDFLEITGLTYDKVTNKYRGGNFVVDSEVVMMAIVMKKLDLLAGAILTEKNPHHMGN